MTADDRNAMVEAVKINHVPPKMPSKAEKSPAFEGIAEAIIKITHVRRLIAAARSEMVFEAFEPKCLVMMSMHINESHEIRIPPSSARASL